MTLTRIVTRLISFVISLILARLLSPSAYGLVAVGMLAISLLRVFTEVGFQQSLIQKVEKIEPLLGTAWTIGVIRGIVISAGMFIFSGWIADFFGSPDALPIIQVLSLQPLIFSLTNIYIVYFQKQLDFFKQFLYEVSALLGNLLVGVGLALLWRNAWALVFGQLASVTIQVMVSYILFPVTPKIEINYSFAKDLFSFGKWVFLSGIVGYFAMRGDTYFVGKYFDEKTLGLYSLAYKIGNIPVDELKSSLGRILFPVYSRIQGNTQRRSKAFINAYELLLLVMLPATVGISLIAKDFVPIALGSQWVDMIPLLQILGLGAAARALMVAGSGFTYGIGKPYVNFYQSLIRGLVLFVFMFFLPQEWGLLRVGWSVLISNLLAFGMWFLYMITETEINVYSWLKIFFYVIPSLIFMSSLVLVMQSIMVAGTIRFILTIIIGVISYLTVTITSLHLLNRPIRNYVSRSINNILGWSGL